MFAELSFGRLGITGMLENMSHPPSKGIVRESSGPTDNDLIDRISRSDASAMETLYLRYFPRVSRFAQRLLASPEMIEEAVNDVMYVVWRKAATFNGPGQVSTWIFGIAYRTCLKMRGSGPSDDHLPLDEAEDLLPSSLDSGLEALEREDWVARLFEQLPLEQRAVLELTYHQDLTYGEIAVILGCPENTVKTRMFHARKKIRAFLPRVNGDFQACIEGTP